MRLKLVEVTILAVLFCFEWGGPIFGKRVLDNMPTPSLSSHLSSSPMGIFSRAYGSRTGGDCPPQSKIRGGLAPPQTGSHSTIVCNTSQLQTALKQMGKNLVTHLPYLAALQHLRPKPHNNFKYRQCYSALNKESTFSEILISAVKSTFSPSDHQKKPQRTPLDKFSQDLFFPIYNPQKSHRSAEAIFG